MPHQVLQKALKKTRDQTRNDIWLTFVADLFVKLQFASANLVHFGFRNASANDHPKVLGGLTSTRAGSTTI